MDSLLCHQRIHGFIVLSSKDSWIHCSVTGGFIDSLQCLPKDSLFCHQRIHYSITKGFLDSFICHQRIHCSVTGGFMESLLCHQRIHGFIALSPKDSLLCHKRVHSSVTLSQKTNVDGWLYWVTSWWSVTHMCFLAFSHQYFPKPPTTFLTCFSRGERRKYIGDKFRLF